MNMNENLLKKLMYRYTFTFFVINLSESLTVLIDQMIVSRNLGANAMAAMGLSSPAFAIMSLLCSFFTIGMQTICAKAMNCGDREKIEKVFNTGVLIVGIAAVVTTVIGLAGLDYVCMLFGAEPEDAALFHELREYMRGVIIGTAGYMGYILLSPLAALEGNRRAVTIAAVVQNVLNIGGDLISVRFLHFGIGAVGLCTGLSWLVAFAIMLPMFTKKNTAFRFRFMKPDWRSFTEMTTIGSTRFTRYFSKIFSKLLVNRLVLYFGSTLAMSALSVNHSLTGFILVTGVGASECISLCTQMAYNERDRDYLVLMMRIARKMVLSLSSLTIVLMVAVLLLADPLAALFIVDQPELHSLTAFSLRCMAVQIPVNAINCILIAYLQGSKRIKLTNFMSFVHRFVSLAVFTLILGACFRVYGVFIAVPVSEFADTLIYLIIAFRRSPSDAPLIEKILMLPSDFDEGIRSSTSFSVCTMEEVVCVSEQVGDFLTAAGIEDPSIVYKTSLCLEEMASNVVKYGFHKDNNQHSCDIRILVETDGGIVLRIRDDCPLFNVRERYECIDRADVCSNLGIRMVFDIANDVSYFKLLGLNTVQIRIDCSKEENSEEI